MRADGDATAAINDRVTEEDEGAETSLLPQPNMDARTQFLDCTPYFLEVEARIGNLLEWVFPLLASILAVIMEFGSLCRNC